jgi:cation transport ATPase
MDGAPVTKHTREARRRIIFIVALALVAELITGSVRWGIHGHVPQLTNDYLFFCLTIAAYPLLVGFFIRRTGIALITAGLCGALVFVASSVTSAAAWLNDYGSLAEFPVRMLSASAAMIPTQVAFGLLGAWLASLARASTVLDQASPARANPRAH